jgi:hypothetical protein
MATKNELPAPNVEKPESEFSFVVNLAKGRGYLQLINSF